MRDNDLKYWLSIAKIPDIGDRRIKILYDHFASPQKIWEADLSELKNIEGIGSSAADKIENARRAADIENMDVELPEGTKAVCLSDEIYPRSLKNIYDPPPVLYMKGELADVDSRSIAVVGTRKPSPYGEDSTRTIVRDLVEAGFTIVSGLAHGIDSCAHKAALEFRGRTIAVLGTSIDKIYPYSNKRLSDEISRSGALLSEFPIGSAIEKWNFPRRNRIISGLSLGTLVVEGTCDSGSLITAKSALEQNREVFAVPGAIDSTLSGAPNSLIKQGAKLVQNIGDILEEFNIDYDRVKQRESIDLKDLSEEEKKILRSILSAPRHIDDISRETGFPVKDIFPLITSLAMKNVIKELPGKHFSAVK